MEISISYKYILIVKLYKIQYLHLSPFNCNTSTHLFCFESISFLRVSYGISFQYCLMQDFKVSLSLNWHLFCILFLTKFPTNFLIEFKSGDLVGRSKTSIFFVLDQSFVGVEVCMAAFFCWKMALIAPQIITDPPPNSLFENCCFSFLKSCQ